MTTDTEESYNTLFRNFYNQFPKFGSGKVYNSQTFNSRPEQPTTLITTVYVTNSFFYNCCIQGKGGAILYGNENGRILIEFTTFSKCYTIQNTENLNFGGAIHAYYCSCVIDCVCCNGCCARNNIGQFCHISSGDDKIHFVLTSSACLSPQSDQNNCVIYMDYGKQLCKSVNVSYNKVYMNSGIVFDHGIGKQFITYCSLNSNEASYSRCVGLVYSIGDKTTVYEMSKCNIIYNKQLEQIDGIIHCTKPTTINSCCILGNTNSSLFYAGAEITLINCTLPDKFTVSGLYSIDTNKATPEKSFINNITFTFKAEYCLTGIDSYEFFIPITSTERIPKHYYENKGNDNNIYLISNKNDDISKNEVSQEKITRIEYSRKHSIPRYNVSNTINTNIIHHEEQNKIQERIQPIYMNFLKFISTSTLFSIIVLILSK